MSQSSSLPVQVCLFPEDELPLLKIGSSHIDDEVPTTGIAEDFDDAALPWAEGTLL